MRVTPLLVALAAVLAVFFLCPPPSALQNGLVDALRPLAAAIAAARLTRPTGVVEVPMHACLTRSGALTISHDAHGVPHVLGDTVTDALYGQGFVTAHHRLWQLDVYRRAAMGRLSELVGAEGLPVDRQSRTLGFGRLAARDAAALHEAARTDADAARDLQWLSCFLAGINAHVERTAASPPLEHLLLGVKVEPFSEVELIAISRFICNALTVGIGVEPANSLLLSLLGGEKLAEWTHGYEHGRWPSVLDGSGVGGGNASVLDGPPGDERPSLPQMLSFGPGLGSNAWAVAGKHTASGLPLLAGDPHLPVTLPAMFMQAHVATRQLASDDRALWNATGVFIPGVPGIFIGHTEVAAWSITTSSHDAEDFYMEQVEPCGGGRQCYRFEGRLLPLTTYNETILVKNGAAQQLQVQETHHGPLFTPALFPTLRTPVAYASAALQTSVAPLAFVRANLARDWPSFRTEVQQLRSAQVNLIYADVWGDIAYQLLGSVPVRAATHHGVLPAPGWTAAHDWRGFVPRADMPYSLNPEKGYVASANNCPVKPGETAHYLGSVFMSSYRAERIDQVLSQAIANGTVDLSLSQALQEDTMSLPAAEFVDLVVALPRSSPQWRTNDVRLALRLLQEWTPAGDMAANSIGATVFRVSARELVRVLFEAEPQLAANEAAQRLLLGAPVNPLKPSTELLKHDLKNLLRMLREPSASHWMEAAGGVDVAVPQALGRAVRWLRTRFGTNTATWRWGALHTLDVQHAFHAVPLVGSLLSRKGLEMAGDSYTPMQTAASVRDIENQANDAFSPAYRLLVDLADISHARHQMMPGNDGNFGSPHYDDSIEEFFEGKFRPMLFTDEDIAAATTDVQIITFKQPSPVASAENIK